MFSYEIFQAVKIAFFIGRNLLFVPFFYFARINGFFISVKKWEISAYHSKKRKKTARISLLICTRSKNLAADSSNQDA